MTMEPNNIENQFRDKLNSREIKPSENAWDRLDSMLTEVEKPKRNYRWMYFAASFLGFVLIATVFLSQTEELIDVERQEVVLELNRVQEHESTSVIPIENSKEIVSTSQKSKQEEEVEKKSNLKSNQKLVQQRTESVVLVSNEKVNTPSVVNQKPKVQVDVDALLASVETEQNTVSLAKNTTPVTINSDELLSQVDEELELSFRERVLKSVNKTFKEVKVAVSQRNLK